MGKVLELAEQLWTGKATTHDLQPVTSLLGLEELSRGFAFLSSFANVTLLDTGEGLVLIDAGSFFLAQQNYSQIREWSPRPVSLAVYTHGHVDHAFGLAPFEAEAAKKGAERPRVIAHEAVVDRFDRYQLTGGYNQVINARQFGGAVWPTEYRYPDQTYRDRLDLHSYPSRRSSDLPP